MEELKITTRGRYALMAMVELTNPVEERPMPLSEIARRSDISLSYLEQLIAALRKNNLVKSHRGPGGGYLLARAPEEIRVTEILQAAEDSLPAKRPTAPPGIVNEETLVFWSDIGKILYASLRHVTLADILQKKTRENAHIIKMFEILS